MERAVFRLSSDEDNHPAEMREIPSLSQGLPITRRHCFQKKYVAVEPVLLQGYDWLQKYEAQIQGRIIRRLILRGWTFSWGITGQVAADISRLWMKSDPVEGSQKLAGG